ncbi:MAG: acyltransferase [Sphingomonas fennica]
MRHIATLDGLRGLAAITVVLYHLLEVVPVLPQPPRAYLEVDFFFLLSGYVVGHAYDAKLRAGMGVRRFAAIRLIRLYPLIAAGVLLGAAVWLADTGRGYGPKQVAGAAAVALLMLPVPRANAGRAWPINNSLWSLAFELAGNFAYALAAPRLTTRALAIVTACLLPALALTSWAADGLMVGPLWRWTLPLGLVRMAFPFALGLLMARLARPRSTLPAAGTLSALVLGTMLWAPVADGTVYDPVAVVLVCPLILWLALHAAPGPRAAAVSGWAGALSYPVYALHQPLVQAGGALALRLTPDRTGLALLAAAAILLVIALSWAALLLYDAPVRAWASRRWLRRPIAPLPA